MWTLASRSTRGCSIDSGFSLLSETLLVEFTPASSNAVVTTQLTPYSSSLLLI